MFPNKKRVGSSSTKLLCGILGLLLLLGPYSAMAQVDCERELAEAEQKFYMGGFDEAIALVSRCLNKSDVVNAERVRAHRLLAMAYQAKNYEEQAREAIKKVLELAPNYEPDPDQDLPQYVKLVRIVQEELRQQRQATPQPPEAQPPAEPVTTPPAKKKRGGVPWLLIGGGTGVAAVVAAVLASGGGGGKTPPPPPSSLPTPPDLP